jgi:hypothetical protein
MQLNSVKHQKNNKDILLGISGTAATVNSVGRIQSRIVAFVYKFNAVLTRLEDCVLYNIRRDKVLCRS